MWRLYITFFITSVGAETVHCASSGRHMVLSEWAQCPSCKFPMLAGEFAQVLSHADKACPMCGEQNIAVGDVKVVNDPLAGLKSAASEHQ